MYGGLFAVVCEVCLTREDVCRVAVCCGLRGVRGKYFFPPGSAI